MEDFKRKRISQEGQLDDYDRHIENNSRKNLEEVALSFSRDQGGTSQKKEAKRKTVYLAQVYSMMALAIVHTALWYPPSVRFVKRVFRLKGFWNIHFAIIPIIGHANALLLGALQGYLNVYRFRQNYPLGRDLKNQL